MNGVPMPISRADSNKCKVKVDEIQFKLVEKPLILEPILAKRLPASTNVYNVMRQNINWKNEHRWFTLQDSTVDDVWIVVIYLREDYGQVICISQPPNALITSGIRNAFSQCEFINWSESFWFSSVDANVSSMISEISIRDKGNCTEVHPCYLYYMEPKEALQLNIPTGNYEIKPIDNQQGVEFLLKTWKYKKEGSRDYMENCVRRNLSFGAYVNNEIVADVIFNCHGLFGMLYSLPEFRSQGFGRLVMQTIMKEAAANQFIPGTTVEIRNEIANAFMKRLGFKFAAEVSYIFFRSPTY